MMPQSHTTAQIFAVYPGVQPEVNNLPAKKEVTWRRCPVSKGDTLKPAGKDENLPGKGKPVSLLKPQWPHLSDGDDQLFLPCLLQRGF